MEGEKKERETIKSQVGRLLHFSCQVLSEEVFSRTEFPKGKGRLGKGRVRVGGGEGGRNATL